MIDALPVLNRTDATFKTDVETFFGTDLPAFSVQAEAARVQINSNTTITQQQADLAQAQVPLAQAQTLIATQQAQAAASSALSAGAIAWVSGTTYAIGNLRYSPINSQVYRRLTAGAGTTDPSLDVTNWIIVNGIISENINLPSNNLPVMRPSLNLDFAGNQTVDPRITFTRASTATRTNARGLIEAVASGVPRIDFDAVTGACKGLLIEEQRTNLLTYSEAMDNAAWSKGNLTVTANAGTAPDGLVTVDKLVENTTAAAFHYIQQAVSKSASAVQYTTSYFVSAAGREVIIAINSTLSGGASFRFNPSTGVITAGAGVYGGFSGASASVQTLPNGVYRLALTATTDADTAVISQISLHNGTTSTYTGDGTSGLFIWGAQLEAGAFPTSYQPSTETFTGRAGTATFYGSNGLIQTASSGVARMNYNPMNLTVAPKLLLEASSANLLTYSEAMDNAAWTKVTANVTATANSIAAPDGLTTADTLNSLTASGDNRLAQSATVANDSSVYTGSIFLKKVATSFARVDLRFTGGTGLNYAYVVNLDTLTITSSGGNNALSFGLTPVGNGWYRVFITAPNNSAGNTSSNISCFPSVDSVGSTATVGSVYAWGAQLEASPYATSYIPTVASQVTRVADTSTSAQTTRAADMASMTGANFSSWYRQDEGSFVVGSTRPVTAISDGTLFQVDDGTNSNRLYFGTGSSGSVLNPFWISGGVNQATLTQGANTALADKSSAAAYKLNDFAATVGGATAATDASGAVPVVNAITIGRSLNAGYWNGHIRSLTYYPKRLTNAELQALSTQ